MIRLWRTGFPREWVERGVLIGLGVGVCMFWRGLAMEGPGLGRRGREARLLSPLVFVKVVRGEIVSQCGGSPSTRKGSMAL